MNFSKFRINPETKVDLKSWDASDRSACTGDKEQDRARLVELSKRLDELQELLYAEQQRALLVVLQGMDTSGKDGTIRHVFSAVDPLGVHVTRFKAPTETELAHDYLWRAHAATPMKGEIGIFNRSHYEDVLVVRVHKHIDKPEWTRRYRQINGFERLLAEQRTVIVKFYLHISKDEQKKRLLERLDDPKKQWKFNINDLGERSLWSQYVRAYQDALGATSTEWAPWYVVPSNSKTNRNLFISSVLIETLQSLKLQYPKLKQSLEGIVIK